MNASALLTSQGWLGPGHALDTRLTDYGAQTYKQKGHRGLAYDPQTQTQISSSQTSQQLATGNGLIRPLLISQRHGLKNGIGKKTHEPASGNEWWLKGFASALANVGKSESERSSAVSSGTSTPRHGTVNGYVGKHSGLYNYFTGGTVMHGTIDSSDDDDDGQQQLERKQVQDGELKRGKKRKSDVLEEEEESSSNKTNKDNITVNNPLAVSPVKRPQTARELETSIPYLTERDKSRKKAHNHARSTDLDLETFAVVGEFLGVHEDISRSRKRDKIDAHVRQEEDQTGNTAVIVQETKEERRARRRKRKEEKEKDMEKVQNRKGKGLSLAQMVEEELAKLSSMDNSEVDQDDVVSDSAGQEETLKKARRKKRKEMKVYV